MAATEEIKTLLGDAVSNFTDAQINLAFNNACNYLENYCNRSLDSSLTFIVEKMSVVDLLRTNSEGLSSQSYNGVSENYTDDYPAPIMKLLNAKRKVKVI